MHPSFVALALILFGRHTITATPVTPDISTIAASFPISTLRGFGIHSNITLAPNDIPARIRARQDLPATLLLCASANCASCVSVNVDQPESEAICYESGKQNDFLSVAISQPSNEGLPFAVAVGTPKCEQFNQIPAVNTCFNVN